MKSVILILSAIFLSSCVKVEKSTFEYKSPSIPTFDKLQIGTAISGYKCEFLTDGETKNILLTVYTDKDGKKSVDLADFSSPTEDLISSKLVTVDGIVFIAMPVTSSEKNGLKGSGILLNSGTLNLPDDEKLISINGFIDLDETMNGTINYQIQFMKDDKLEKTDSKELARLENCKLAKVVKI